MSHHQNHTHSSAQNNFNRAFIIGIVLNVIYIVVEVVYGFADKLNGSNC